VDLSTYPARSPRLFAYRRRLAVLVLSLAFLTTAGYWLGSTGSTAPGISPLPGAGPNGELAAVTPMSASVTRTNNGGAQLQVGVALAKIVVASSKSNNFRIHIAWTNANQAGQVMNNPNAQISIGVYHPIYTGSCDAQSNSTDAPLVNVTDSTDSNNTYCAALDQTATGSNSVSSTGKLLLAPSLISGFLSPQLDETVTGSACTSTVNDTLTNWCQPATGVTSSQRALFVIASIVTPGGIPQGQQASLSSLYFFAQATQAG
jgi:hypothetical protein